MWITRHEWKRNRKTMFLWSGIISGLIVIFMMIYPEMAKQADDLMGFYSNLGSFSLAFGLDKISFDTALGFYGVEAGAMISLGGAMYAAILGIGMLSKEEGEHTAEFLMTTPAGRKRVVAEKLAAIGILIFFFNLICYFFGIVSFILIDEKIDSKVMFLYHFAQLVMHLQIASICYGISAFLKKNSYGIGVGIAILLYFLNILSSISDKVKGLSYITPYHYSDAAEIITSNKIDFSLLGLGVLIGSAAVGIAFLYYRKKDLAS